MLHSAQPFIYICLYCGHSRWRSYYQEGDGLRSNYQEGDGLRSHYQEGEWFEILLRCLTLPHFGAYPKPESGFPVPYVMVFMCSMISVVLTVSYQGTCQ
jgi:hypothetical protein